MSSKDKKRELLKKLISQQKETGGTQAGAPSATFSEKLSIECDERTNAVVAYGTSSDFRQIKALVDQLDVVLPQVRLEVVIAEVTLRDGQASGLESFGYQHGNLDAAGKFGVQDAAHPLHNRIEPGFAQLVGETGSAELAKGFLSWGKGSRFTIDGILKTAKENKNIKIVSSPTLLTTHAREAVLSCVETRSYVKAVQTKAGSGTADADVSNSTVDQVDAGIVLNIKPLIGTDGSIQLEIDQKVDTFTTGTMSFGNKSSMTNPNIQKRQIKSFVTAKSGEMIILGGLKKRQMANTKRKTFLLGDIPGIGELFTAKGKTEEMTEMIVFIRPVLLANNEAVREDTELYKANLTPKTRDEVNAYEETGRFSEKPEMDEDDKRKQRIKESKEKRKAEAEEAKQIRKEKQMQARAERAKRREREESASKASRRAHARKVSHKTNVSKTSTSKRTRIRGTHRTIAKPKVQDQRVIKSRKISKPTVHKARQTTEPAKSRVNRRLRDRSPRRIR